MNFNNRQMRNIREEANKRTDSAYEQSRISEHNSQILLMKAW
ncbi:hypothetical protein [endosymbiont GvMRE of Glomus versiforme]|nr:hypothetical protein [endosymbiont GvMRE of Glomus versiforme]